MGGLIGTCLAHSGWAVTLVVREERLGTYPNQLHLEGPLGSFQEQVSVVAEVPAIDVLWITVKATQLESALSSITNPESVNAIVPLLNGIDHISFLRAKYGAAKVIPATIAVESESVRPGRIILRSPFDRLNVSSTGRKILGSTLDQLGMLGFACQFLNDEPTLMWSKLVFLAPLALTTTSANKSLGEILADQSWLDHLEACVREVCAVAIAQGAKVETEVVLSTIKTMPYGLRSSMQKDVEAHRTPELEAIAGPIVRLADHDNIEVSVTKGLVDAVRDRAKW
ncbi:MAG: 2-dehydropantoate 2-reductase [Thermoplasmata archaeon]